ncbi:MAG: hypothetical protein AAGI38_20430 [Bacteroidota bacterium]
MKRKYRDEDIIRFLHDELNPTETEAFLNALTDDEELFDRFEMFQDVSDQISSVTYEPSSFSCDAIMKAVKEEGKSPSQRSHFSGFAPASTGIGVAVLALMFMLMSWIYPGQLQQTQVASFETNIVQQVNLDMADEPWDSMDDKLNSIGDGIESLKSTSDLDESFL